MCCNILCLLCAVPHEQTEVTCTRQSLRLMSLQFGRAGTQKSTNLKGNQARTLSWKCRMPCCVLKYTLLALCSAARANRGRVHSSKLRLMRKPYDRAGTQKSLNLKGNLACKMSWNCLMSCCVQQHSLFVLCSASRALRYSVKPLVDE